MRGERIGDEILAAARAQRRDAHRRGPARAAPPARELWRPNLVDWLVRGAGGIDVLVTRATPAGRRPGRARRPRPHPGARARVADDARRRSRSWPWSPPWAARCAPGLRGRPGHDLPPGRPARREPPVAARHARRGARERRGARLLLRPALLHVRGRRRAVRRHLRRAAGHRARRAAASRSASARRPRAAREREQRTAALYQAEPRARRTPATRTAIATVGVAARGRAVRRRRASWRSCPGAGGGPACRRRTPVLPGDRPQGARRRAWVYDERPPRRARHRHAARRRRAPTSRSSAPGGPLGVLGASRTRARARPSRRQLARDDRRADRRRARARGPRRRRRDAPA